jgi:lipopolysaccharide transport system ATP-binding protein
MGRPAIRVEHLAKAYRLGRAARRSDSLRETITAGLLAPWRRFRELGATAVEDDDFWALNDVSFDVDEGEVVGIIGRNGAGKSTLLKVLSRIVEPTRGSAVLHGRVASLLEVGTGFHPELSGRENIYLNGSILAMRKREIDAKFDEIVDFAGIERFLDTPVKRYSSGMYVRLAFAVAAHLEPEILIVDEVLAVGDAEFQRRCLGKMREVSAGGDRTVLFVSHNMAAVSTLCSRAILLAGGRIVADASPAAVIQDYLIPAVEGGGEMLTLDHHPGRPATCSRHFRSIRILDAQGRVVSAVAPETEVQIEMELEFEQPMRAPRIGIGFNNARGERTFAIATYLSPVGLGRLDTRPRVRALFRMPPLFPGRYLLDISLSAEEGRFMDQVEGATWLEVLQDGYLGSAHPYFAEMGVVLVPSRWASAS